MMSIDHKTYQTSLNTNEISDALKPKRNNGYSMSLSLNQIVFQWEKSTSFTNEILSYIKMV